MRTEEDTEPVYSVAALPPFGPLEPAHLPPGAQFEPLEDAPSPRVLPKTASFFGADVDAKAEQYEMMARTPLHQVGVFRVAGGEVLGCGLVATCDRVLLAGGVVTGPPEVLATPVWGNALTRRKDGRYAPNRPGMTRRKIDGPAILGICPGYKIYGHILVDWLPRIVAAASTCGPDVPIIVPTFLPGYAQTFLAMLGIDTRRLIAVDETREIVTADELIVASQVRAASRWWPGAARLLRPLIGENEAAADLPRRFYVTRGKVRNQRRRLLNRDQVVAALDQRGFWPVAPETLPLARQLTLFARAECVVGEAGSGLHNSVFGTPDLRVGVVQADTLGSFLQASLCGAVDQSIAFTFGDSPSFTPTSNFGDFAIDPDALQDMIDHVMLGLPI